MVYVMWAGLTMFVSGTAVLAHIHKDNNKVLSTVSVIVLVMGALIAFAGAAQIGAR
jgi:hypothetical protein